MAKGVGFTIREYAKSDKILYHDKTACYIVFIVNTTKKFVILVSNNVFLVDILEGFYAYPPLKNVVTMGVEDSSYR
jgi:hypothetical protein